VSKSKSRRKLARPIVEEPPLSSVNHTRSIFACQQVLRSLTAAMIGAFVLIVILTTISVNEAIQIVGQGLYFIILASVVISLFVWLVRIRFERQMGKNPPTAAEILKRV
jgi:hypothetical protein